MLRHYGRSVRMGDSCARPPGSQLLAALILRSPLTSPGLFCSRPSAVPLGMLRRTAIAVRQPHAGSLITCVPSNHDELLYTYPGFWLTITRTTALVAVMV